MSAPTFTPRVFSGIQPSGGLTLGNYLGMVKRAVAMQGRGSVRDDLLHGRSARDHRLAGPGGPAPKHARDRGVLHRLGNRPQTLNPVQPKPGGRARATAWIFNCVARMGWMGRMTQWKDKAGKNSETPRLAFCLPRPDGC